MQKQRGRGKKKKKKFNDTISPTFWRRVSGAYTWTPNKNEKINYSEKKFAWMVLVNYSKKNILKGFVFPSINFVFALLILQAQSRHRPLLL